MEYYVNFKADWLNEIAPHEFEDKDLFRIVVFFVFHSPCENVSARGISMQDYHWSNPWNEPYYLNQRLIDASNNPKLLYSAKNYEIMGDKLKEANLRENFPCDFSKERICFHNCKKNNFLSVFYHLRNAFSHGRLNMVNIDGECVFVIEDISPKCKKGKHLVSARMILKKSTLLKWIDIIERGETEYIPKKKPKKA